MLLLWKLYSIVMAQQTPKLKRARGGGCWLASSQSLRKKVRHKEQEMASMGDFFLRIRLQRNCMPCIVGALTFLSMWRFPELRSDIQLSNSTMPDYLNSKSLVMFLWFIYQLLSACWTKWHGVVHHKTLKFIWKPLAKLCPFIPFQ